ncbi:MAG: MBOAT family protein [Syntrophobacterales bacterium]|nr:MBOAT family protein [Syntrophobacterales bacterium]
MLLVASYVFYSAWDWRFLSLIVISTILDYYCGIGIFRAATMPGKRRFLIASIVGNLSILAFFKYYNFFIANGAELLQCLGFTVHYHTLLIILPLGISFYTFQTMSYTIDIYNGRIKPTTNFYDLALFVAFFPQLVAGPIEKARDLLPQIIAPRQVTLENIYRGCYLIFWGLFQKVFIADNLAKLVDPVFASDGPYNGAMVLVALYAFAFQILCDFEGYSNIARGVGRCLGFEIMVNFNLPYFAANPREFWRRWHISLSSWLRDYLYIPLGGSRKGTWKTHRNVGITMLLGGLWHGASWTFIIWGGYHGMLLILHRLLEPLKGKVAWFRKGIAKNLAHLSKIIIFFHLVCLGWLMFRSQSMEQVGSMLKALVFDFRFTHEVASFVYSMIFCIALFFIVQVSQYIKRDLMVVLRWPAVARTALYLMCFYLLILYGVTGGNEFIYFQF